MHPGPVATFLTKADPAFFQVITSESCAKGALNNATSMLCYGGWVHEVQSYILKCLYDLLPLPLKMRLGAVVGQKMKTISAQLAETYDKRN